MTKTMRDYALEYADAVAIEKQLLEHADKATCPDVEDLRRAARIAVPLANLRGRVASTIEIARNHPYGWSADEILNSLEKARKDTEGK